MDVNDDEPDDVKRAVPVEKEIKKGEKDDTFEGYPPIKKKKERWQHCAKPSGKKKATKSLAEGECCEMKKDKAAAKEQSKYVTVMVFGKPCVIPKMDIIPRHCLSKKEYVDLLATPHRRCPTQCQQEAVVKKLKPVSQRIKELARPNRQRMLMTLQEGAARLKPEFIDNLIKSLEGETCLTPEQAAKAFRDRKRKRIKKKREEPRKFGRVTRKAKKPGMMSGTTLDKDAVTCQYLMAERFVKSILDWKCPIPKNEYQDIARVIIRRLSYVLEYTPLDESDRKSQQMRFLADVIACWISGVLFEVAEDQKAEMEEVCERKRKEAEEEEEEEEEEDEETDEDTKRRRKDRDEDDEEEEDEEDEEEEEEEKDKELDEEGKKKAKEEKARKPSAKGGVTEDEVAVDADADADADAEKLAEEQEVEEQERLQLEEKERLQKEKEEEEARLQKEKEEEEERLRLEEEARLQKEKEEEEERLRLEEEARLQKEKEEEEARLQKEKEEEEARLQKEKEEEAARLQKEKEEEAARLQKEKEEEEARLKKEKEEEEARLKKEKEEEEARLQKEKEEEEARLQKEKEEEEERLRVEEEARLQKAKEEEEAKLQQEKEEEEERLRLEEEAKLQKAKEEEEAKLQQAKEAEEEKLRLEEEARLQKEKEEEEAKLRSEEEKLRLEEEAKLQKEKEEEAARLQKEKEEEAERLRLEEEAKLQKEKEEEKAALQEEEGEEAKRRREEEKRQREEEKKKEQVLLEQVEEEKREKSILSIGDYGDLFGTDVPFVTFGKLIDVLYAMLETMPEAKGVDQVRDRIQRAIYDKIGGLIEGEDPEALDEHMRDVLIVLAGKIANWLKGILSESQIMFLDKFPAQVESIEVRDWTMWLASVSDTANDWASWLRKVVEEAEDISEEGITRGDWQNWTKSVDIDALLWRRFHLQALHQAHRNVTLMAQRQLVKTGNKTLDFEEKEIRNTNLSVPA
ncbi:hypothetical protein KPH14_001696 [Odynerus spinipes]|uniref:Uncharacterized protein n=1 Tax=Odynerus spinipes TaxID=1348599 RepID=A0AAD9RZT1_9HYME|nr:hypothetical protein KPH14_001696 [Odynerus spinipes]